MPPHYNLISYFEQIGWPNPFPNPIPTYKKLFNQPQITGKKIDDFILMSQNFNRENNIDHYIYRSKNVDPEDIWE